MNRLRMNKVKEVLRLRSMGFSYRDIGQSVGCGKSVVGDVLMRAAIAGITYDSSLSETELEEKIFPPEQTKDTETAIDIEYILAELSRPHVTRQLLWEEYKRENPNGLMYSQFCERIRLAKKADEFDYHKTHKAGEECEVDWAGTPIQYYDAASREWVDTFLFVAVLPASAYPFARAYLNRKTPNWIDAHIRAFRFFGGTPRVLIPDCTKTAVTSCDLFDPVLNETYKEMACHYGITIVPARPYKPKDKGGVENAVLNVSRRIIAALRNEKFTSLEEINAAVDRKLQDLIDRPFKKMSGSRRSAFEAMDKPALRPLPEERYEYADYTEGKIGFNYHVEYDGHFYSVPCEYKGGEYLLRATRSVVEVFVKGERICAHQRSYNTRNRYETQPEHLPENHKAVSEWNDERFISWAEKYGGAVCDYIKALLSKSQYSVQSYRSCMGVMRLAKATPAAVLEDACRFALQTGPISSNYLGLVIKQKLKDKEGEREEPIVKHENIRGAEAYGGGECCA